MRLGFLCALSGLCLMHGEVNAENMFGLNTSGSLRSSYWSSSMNLDHRNDLAVAELWFKAAPRLSDDVSLSFEGWAGNQDIFREGRDRSLVREGYISASLGDIDLRVGKQIIVWGRADKLNPTDNLTQRNYTLLVSADEDQREGLLATQATWNFESFTLTGIWMPGTGRNTLPLPHQAGLNFVENNATGTAVALKLEQTGNDIDWSISYFDGNDPNPDMSIGSVGASGLTLNLDHHRIRVVGADAATVVGKYGLRGELAYTRTEDESGTNPFIKNPFVYLVAGGDRTFLEYLNINLQYYARKVMNYKDPATEPDLQLRTIAEQGSLASNQADRFQHGMSFRISEKWLNETMEGEVAGIVSFSHREYVLKPKLVYAFSDLWKGSLGANLFRGGSKTFYGSLRDNSNVYLELRYVF